MLINRIKQVIANESGVAIIVSLLIMVVLGVLGATALMVSSTDISIGGNYRQAQETFYAADGGSELCNCLINRTLDERNVSAADQNIIQDLNFVTEIISTIADPDNVTAGDANFAPDIQTKINLLAVDVDVDRVSETIVREGSAMEFLSGYEGIGGGLASGGGGMRFRIDSVGRGTNAISNVETMYEYVIGIGG
ncbi:MAG: PilX N-terminal domain-containing pilus assembly protein [Nitrospinota bacterium]